VVTRFDRDSGVEATGIGRYRARLDPGWWAGGGPNGGYVAAIVMHACEDAVGDDTRRCRSFTTHYLSRATEGDIEVHVDIERAGRSMTSVSARLLQADRVIAVALGAYSTGRDGPSFADLPMPEVPRPEDLIEPGFDPRLPAGAIPEIARRYEQRRVAGPRPFSGGDEARVGGWIRLPESRPVDASVLVAFSDAWIPALFSRISGPWGITTVDLTVHVRALPPVDHDGWCFVQFGSTASQDGFCEEDGVIWSSDGTLLAHTRQLMALLPMG
jgi:acyl-CoA thioesterase